MTTSLAYLDAKSKSIVWAAYAEHFAGEEISEEGFNTYSGYAYLSLDCGVTLGSSYGQDVEFIIFHFETGEEIFFQSIDELNAYLNEINN
jgi:hypothetical protein